MTDQELLQISGDLNANSTITPLFEKILSASDAGRIGRLVLPKACAEAYFPAINNSEGLPIRIQDIKGKEWTFQFRFWPNNNSRMYVLEGVTPCIRNMQLQAGDTVIFSRLDPGEKLVIGCRKAAVSTDTKPEGETASANGVAGGTSAGNGNLPTKNVEHESMANGVANGDQKPLIQEKKKTRNIGSKNKRLLMHNEDAMELKVTWEEAHELLRPSPTANPTISMIEDCEFEEYDEPPVFGKNIFTMNASGCTCSVPDEISTKDLEQIFKFGKDPKKRKLAVGKVAEEQAASALDALATAAVLGENIGELCESSSGPTTRHPRHRPGCTCIVCIQPPSGKGKHKPNCFCNVCLTVRRRFKTLMFRKKKRLSDREAEEAQKSLLALTNGVVPDDSHGIGISDQNGIEVEVGESSSKHKPKCFCNVCLTVRPQFKTLMFRKKKRLSDREAEEAQNNGVVPDDSLGIGISDQNGIEVEVGESSSKFKPKCFCNVCLTVRPQFETLMFRKKKRLSDREAEEAQNNGVVPDDSLGIGISDQNGIEVEVGESSSKHKPKCFCNVCLTVRPQFETLMFPKKKRLSDREAEEAQNNGVVPDDSLGIGISDQNGIEVEVGESSSKHKPKCFCNVCLTVRPQFETLMFPKKKRLSDREAEEAQNNGVVPDDSLGIGISDQNGIEVEVEVGESSSKHKPKCFCNVCLTVRPLFKTLMFPKKKRLSDREAEEAQKSLLALTNGVVPDDSLGIGISDQNGIEVEVGESSSKGGQQLDLNCDLDKEDEMILVNATSTSEIPLEWQSVLTGLVPCLLPTSTSEIEGQPSPSSVATTHLPTDEVLILMDDAEEHKMDEKFVDDGVSLKQSGL